MHVGLPGVWWRFEQRAEMLRKSSRELSGNKDALTKDIKFRLVLFRSGLFLIISCSLVRFLIEKEGCFSIGDGYIFLNKDCYFNEC
jgi:hypothetical protein